ncbi:MAG: histidine--tRNA ligase [Candidatus Omnitrophica bacterium]|nr:histidine--tRNA ligase [Candidatus Omnitrophota bacterium]
MSNKEISIPRGTADIFGDEVLQWSLIEQKAREILQNYNYKEIRTPMFEEVDLFARSMGKTSDVVQKQMLTLERNTREGEMGESQSTFALRPEGTASVVRSYIENSIDRKEPLTKLFYIGSMFRGERPQKGRLRQFNQIGVEAIGPDSQNAYLDAEVISLAMNLLASFGVKDATLKINSLGTPEDKEKFAQALREQLKDKKSSLCENCQQRFDRNIFRVLDCKNRDCKKEIEALEIKSSYLSKESQEYYNDVKKALAGIGVAYQETPDLVRGLDYYTGVVFEITSQSLGSQDALGAGGRYNGLVEQLGGTKGVDAVGFSLGIERILLAINETAQQEISTDVCLVALDENAFEKAFSILNELRASGVKSDIVYRAASVKAQMRTANKTGAKYVLILGQDEISKGIITLKNMQIGEQEEIQISKIVEFIKSIL